MQAQHRYLEWRLPPSRCFAAARRHGASHAAARPQTVVSAAAQDQVAFDIPQSRNEAVSASVAALMGQLKRLSGSKRSKKGFGSSGGSSGSSNGRFTIELPLPSDSPAQAATLANDILSRLPTSAANASIVFASDKPAAAAAKAEVSKRGTVLSLRGACQADRLQGPLVLVEPTTADVALVEQLLEEVWEGPWALAVNPTWHTNTPQQYQALVNSFEAVYSFMPIVLQGLIRAEGAVLRQLSPGSSSGSSPWRVLMKQGEKFMQVGQMKKRPLQSDLELVFMNARAASSPLTSLVKGVKGMLDKSKK